MAKLEPGVLIFITLVAFVGFGVLWFRVIRPMLEDFGVLAYADGEAEAAEGVKPFATTTRVDYVNDGNAGDDDAAPVPAFERAERPRFVPPVQVPNAAHLGELDIARLDTLARLMAAGAVSESTAITAVWDGRAGAARVSKGGARAYTDRRDALRALAVFYGWQPPTPDRAPDARLVPINGGDKGYIEV